MIACKDAFDKIFWVALSACFCLALDLSCVQADDQEPIAYVGHGGFFDATGRQVTPTADFVAKAQDWYLSKLLSSLSADKKAEFARFDAQLHEGVTVAGQAGLLFRQRLLVWLVANSPELAARTRGKLQALKYALSWTLPAHGDSEHFGRGEFQLNGDFAARLSQFETPPAAVNPRTPTTNTQAAYTTECMNNNVPIPPSIGDLSVGKWKSQGFIPTSEQFIVGTPAEVRTYESTTPPGMCIALPRYTGISLTTVMLDGVICLGQSGKVCFWDNQMNGSPFSFPSGTQIPIGAVDLSVDPSGRYQAGGGELADNGPSDVCTDCHAGENPFIIHPNTDLGGGVLMGSMNLTNPGYTFAPQRYDPLVLASWAQNQLSMSAQFVPAACAGCHFQGYAGRFPHLSTDLPGYCGTILGQAIQNALPHTMPPGSPGSLWNDPAVQAFQAYCGDPPSAGPSNRGDPHLVTTNGIHYDFQSAGEFTALRNSDSGFELQTRQTGVSTTFTPGANPYTGLASCVSLNTAAAVRLGVHRVSYQPSAVFPGKKPRLEVRIDGVVTKVSSKGISLGGANAVAKASGGGLDIKGDDGTRVLITQNYWSGQGYWYLDVEVINTPAREGVMGRIPGSDWLPLAPDGSSFGPAPGPLHDRYVLLNQTFADAWRVTPVSSLFDYAPGTSTADFTDTTWPPESGPCQYAGSSAPPAEPMDPLQAAKLCAKIEDTVARADCEFDLTVTGQKGFAKLYKKAFKLRNKALGIH